MLGHRSVRSGCRQEVAGSPTNMTMREEEAQLERHVRPTFAEREVLAES